MARTNRIARPATGARLKRLALMEMMNNRLRNEAAAIIQRWFRRIDEEQQMEFEGNIQTIVR